MYEKKVVVLNALKSQDWKSRLLYDSSLDSINKTIKLTLRCSYQRTYVYEGTDILSMFQLFRLSPPFTSAT